MGIVERSLKLQRSIDEVFPFFADARNLEALTPPWLQFKILTPPPIEMAPGALIEYSLRFRGIPIRWRTEITEWEPPYRFVDTQIRGPYRRWVHTHTFEETDGVTTVSDHVDYAAPGGAWLERRLVQPDVERIFDFRNAVLEQLFRAYPEAQGQ